MPDYLAVPVHVAKQIADHFAKDVVVVLSFDREHMMTHTTTYGRSALDKENAAAAGEIATKAVGGDLSQKIEFEDFHNDYSPGRLKEAIELLDAAVKAGGMDAVMLERASRIVLNTNGIANVTR